MAAQYELTDDSVVVVIGSGAGGGTLANELAQKGIGVVCLEAGGRLTLNDIENDPAVMDQRLGWHDRRIGAPLWVCKTVGGTTMRWSGIAPRFLPHEFEARSTYGALDNTSLIDWPLTYDEIEPYYDRAEDKIGITGTHGMPPSLETANFKVLRAGGRNVGYTQITAERTAINSIARDGRPACQQIGFCHSGCRIGAKWSTLYTEIPKAEATDHFELRSGAMVVQINHDDQGRVTGVIYVDADGQTQEQRARAVAVAGNVVETTRLLLNSSSGRFPSGLGNGWGQVGRNYMQHVTSMIYGVMPGPVYGYRGPRQAGIILDEQAHREDRGFAGGYLIETAADHPGGIADTFRGWGESAASFMENYNNLAGVFITGEDPPQATNRISLHATEADHLGLPVPVVEYARHPNSVAMAEHAIERTTAIYESLGSTDVRATRGVGLACHNMGVARMSENAEDGVTNRFGQVHDIPNLFVSDGSVFSSSAAPNPTLTIVALAIRQADHIADRMARREL